MRHTSNCKHFPYADDHCLVCEEEDNMNHGPIDPEFHKMMNDLAEDLDMIFNQGLKGEDKKTGFVLLLMPFNGPKGQRTNYISNAKREDIVEMMREVITRFEEQGARNDKPD